jgi:hypothetical protein
MNSEKEVAEKLVKKALKLRKEMTPLGAKSEAIQLQYY